MKETYAEEEKLIQKNIFTVVAGCLVMPVKLVMSLLAHYFFFISYWVITTLTTVQQTLKSEEKSVLSKIISWVKYCSFTFASHCCVKWL